MTSVDLVSTLSSSLTLPDAHGQGGCGCEIVMSGHGRGVHSNAIIIGSLVYRQIDDDDDDDA